VIVLGLNGIHSALGVCGGVFSGVKLFGSPLRFVLDILE
jgi:hypothetical protein